MWCEPSALPYDWFFFEQTADFLKEIWKLNIIKTQYKIVSTRCKGENVLHFRLYFQNHAQLKVTCKSVIIAYN